MHIFIVDSDQEASKRLQELLENQGHHVRRFPGVAEALPALQAEPVDLIVAECRQLEANGAGLFRVLGQRPHPSAVLPMTPHPMAGYTPPNPAPHQGQMESAVPGAHPAAQRLASRVAEAGRLQAIVAQAQQLLIKQDSQELRVGDLIIDLPGKRVTLRDQQVFLPPIQFRLLAYLVQNAGRVVAAQELLKAVWGYSGDENEARELVKVHVRQIRRKLGLDAQHADYVQSVRGFGYVVTAPK